MDVTLVTNQNDATVIIVKLPDQRIIGATVSAVRMELAKIIKFHKTCVLLDFSQVEFIDSMGMALIFSAIRACKSYGAEAKLVHLNPQPQLALTLAGVDEMIEFYDNPDQAIQAFQRPVPPESH